jgi:pantothenate kinase
VLLAGRAVRVSLRAPTETDVVIEPPHVRPPAVAGSIQELATRLPGSAREGTRFLLGLAGEPGAGKSTVAAQLVAALGADAVVVPFDGFHLASAVLGPDARKRRGAIDTFDLAGFHRLVQRLREADEPVVYAPAYAREIEDPVAAAIAVPRTARVVVVEGNYLLSDSPELTAARALFDQIWFLDVDAGTRRRRLMERHIRFGKSPAAAAEWAEGSDEVNAAAIRATRVRADLVVRIEGELAAFDKGEG